MGAGAGTYSTSWTSRSRLRRFLAGSLALHVSAAAACCGAVLDSAPARHEQWGDINGGGLGSVAVDPVATDSAAEPHRAENPVANDTESPVPTPPPKTKAAAQGEGAEPDAIPIKSRNATRRRNRPLRAQQVPRAAKGPAATSFTAPPASA